MYSQNNVWIKSKQFHFGLKATQRRLQLFYQSERLTYMLGYVSSVAARQKDLFHITPRTLWTTWVDFLNLYLKFNFALSH